MKGFVKKGFVLLALGILIAGCTGSTEESSVTPNHGNGISGIPMSYNPQTNSLDIGNGTGAFQYKTLDVNLDGHSVEVLNGATPCYDDADGNGNCWVRLKNLDPKYYMANAFVMFSICASCGPANHIMENFDAENIDLALLPGAPGSFWDLAGNPIVSDAFTVHKPTNTAGQFDGGTTPIKASNGTFSGIAYVADASNDATEVPNKPYNPYGAPMIDEAGLEFNVRPAYVIAPKCGVRSELWDFGGTDTVNNFPFWAQVKASWFQMNPLGDDFVRGGADANADDPRFDFMHYTTVYLTISDLMINIGGADSAARKWYRPGSIYRSNVLAGYKPAWAKPFAGYTNKNLAEIDFTGGQKYFAVNVGVEAPDEMEAQDFGLQSNPVYEYYTNPQFTISWDPTVLTTPMFTGWKNTKPVAGSFFQQLSNSQCALALNCTLYTKGAGANAAANTWRALDFNQYDTFAATELGDRGGYIAIFARNTIKGEDAFWSYFMTSEYYSWWDPLSGVVTKYGDGGIPAGGSGLEPPPRTIPKTFFFRGFARIRCLTANDSTCIQQDRPDADPEYWMGTFVMKVLPGTVGMGSEIKLDSYQTNSGYDYAKSFEGFDTGGNPDATTNAGPSRISDQANFVVTNGSGVEVVGGSPTREIANPMIRHRGPAVDGTYQGWNVSVCVK